MSQAPRTKRRERRKPRPVESAVIRYSGQRTLLPWSSWDGSSFSGRTGWRRFIWSEGSETGTASGQKARCTLESVLLGKGGFGAGHIWVSKHQLPLVLSRRHSQHKGTPQQRSVGAERGSLFSPVGPVGPGPDTDSLPQQGCRVEVGLGFEHPICGWPRLSTHSMEPGLGVEHVSADRGQKLGGSAGACNAGSPGPSQGEIGSRKR